MMNRKKIKLTLFYISLLVIIVVFLGFGCGLKTKLQTVNIQGLPKDLNNIKIAHLSDLHVKEKISVHEEIINKLAEIKPDIIVLTGDFVEEPEKIEICIKFVKQLKAKYGVWAVMGNWDYWMGSPNDLKKRLKEVGVNILINENRRIEIGNNFLYLAGVDDPFTKRDNLNLALKGIPLNSKQTFTILLAHSPNIFKLAKQHNISLTLAGHTHGGQVRLPLIGPLYSLTPTMGKYSMGLFKENNYQMYVNPGIGVSKIPFRLFCPPELTIIQLHTTK
jgi:uncharacterized protein